MKKQVDNKEYRTVFQNRLRIIAKNLGSQRVLAEKIGVTERTIAAYASGETEPKAQTLSQIAKAGNITLEWLINGGDFLATGQGNSNPEADNQRFVPIPRYDARLSAGAGAWNDDNATLLDYIHFTHEFLQKKLGRTNIEGLVILDAVGDSMEPTINNDDLVMIDRNAEGASNGIYAFVLRDTAHIKRFTFLANGGLKISSDNKEYESETLSPDESDTLHIIGRAIWRGHVF
ncbi:MAG: S24 family peptidase [Pseudomonadota bacterium]